MTRSAPPYRVTLRLYVVFSLLMAVSAAGSGLLLLYLARPFQISVLLYRLMEPNAQLLEFKCVEFAEDLLYGAFKKDPTKPTVEIEKGAGSR